MCAPVLTMSTQEGSWICCGEGVKEVEEVQERKRVSEGGGAKKEEKKEAARACLFSSELF